MRKKELIERDAEELMQESASDELFLADLNETMKDFGYADQEDHEFLTVDPLANLDPIVGSEQRNELPSIKNVICGCSYFLPSRKNLTALL